ncbi:MAG: hypothetical protein ABI868_19345 [Acidobacteriota bacterium]
MSASWRGPAQFAGVTLIMTVLAMWAARPPAGCALPPEPRRHLDLERTVDREHLVTDLAASERVARRWTPPLETSTASGAAAEPGFDLDAEGCHARLVRQIMTTHDVTPAQVQALARTPG